MLPEKIAEQLSPPGVILVELNDSMGNDRAVAQSAWTSSYDKSRYKFRTDEDVARVVRMLAEEGHSVPFESVIFRFWFRIPIFVDRQIMTHRVASQNGLSGRYRTLPKDCFGVPEDVVEILEKADNLDVDVVFNYDRLMREQQEKYTSWLKSLKQAEKDAKITNAEYKRAREVLRGVLGTSTMTERVSIFNLRSFSNFIPCGAGSSKGKRLANIMRFLTKDDFYSGLWLSGIVSFIFWALDSERTQEMFAASFFRALFGYLVISLVLNVLRGFAEADKEEDDDEDDVK